MGKLAALIAGFLRHAGGNMAMTAAIATPALLTAGAVAIDMSNANSYQSKLRSIADAAAITAARELRLGNATQTTILSVARASAAGSSAGMGIDYTFGGDVDIKARRVTVSLTGTMPAGIGAAVGLVSPVVTVNATAQVMGGAPICAVALDEVSNSAFSLDRFARVQANGCTVYSNSKSAQGLQARDSAQLTSASTCTAGGYTGTGSFTPTPDRDCPVFPDPLSSRPNPAMRDCGGSYSMTVVSASGTFLSPGTYCGGININQSAQVTLQPGVYVIVGGPLMIGTGAKLTGNGVTIFFSGDLASMNMQKDSSIALSAPKTGPTAGMLLQQDRNTPSSTVKFEISSDDAATLLGTIYLPRGKLFVGGDKPVAQNSAYTIVIANRIEATAGPTLVLNSNYGASDVPVPAGVGPYSMAVGLQR